MYHPRYATMSLNSAVCANIPCVILCHILQARSSRVKTFFNSLTNSMDVIVNYMWLIEMLSLYFILLLQRIFTVTDSIQMKFAYLSCLRASFYFVVVTSSAPNFLIEIIVSQTSHISSIVNLSTIIYCCKRNKKIFTFVFSNPQ